MATPSATIVRFSIRDSEDGAMMLLQKIGDNLISSLRNRPFEGVEER